MSRKALLARMVDAFDTSQTPYMLTGSFASSYHGLPRSTQDVDFVIDPSRAQLDRLIALFSAEECYLSEDAAYGAHTKRGQFNILELESGLKADLIFCKDRAFSREEFSRRMHARILGVDLFVARPEDLVLAKLEWASRGSSERQLEDARGILKVKRDGMDMAYLQEWAERLSLANVLQSLLENLRP